MAVQRSLLPLALALCAPALAHAQHNLDPGVAGDLTLSLVVDGFAGPTAAQFLPDGRLVVLEQGGNFKVWTGAGQPVDAGHIDVATTAGEQGLLGLAVDPMFATTNRLYFYYSELGASTSDRHRVAYATIDPATNQVDVDNRTVILQGMYGPANHNGGGLAFGPDGNLYVGVGDTGCNCGCSPGTNDQNYFGTCLTNLNGKILRVARDGSIPGTNPLAGTPAVAACGAFNTGNTCQGQAVEPNQANTAPGKAEIYNWGFRNPWRFSFDPQTGYLWIGDVGEVTWEEVTISKGPGEHHGWPYREGLEGDPVATCATATPLAGNCVEPVLVYNHSETPARGAASITGGVFSDHCSWPAAWRGRYWFGDYNKSRVWTVTPNANRDGIDGNRTVVVTGGGVDVVHFFTGNDGAIYYVSIEEGSIHRIGPANPESCNPGDAGIADTGVADTGGGDPDATINPDATPGADATGGADATVINPDAATGADAGASVADAGGTGTTDEGCGCTSSAADRGGMVAGLALLALALLRRRRS